MSEPRAEWPFGGLRMFGYQMIMADPLWTFQTRSARGVTPRGAGGQYRTMDLAAIAALPVNQLAGGDCVLWLWATHPMLPQALYVMHGWGFRFVSSGVWVKRTARGRLAFGTGYRLRCASEPFLLGVIGDPATARDVRTVVEGPLREHSRKPDEAYAAAERLMPDAFRADLFARERRPGWDAFGDEAEKFVRPTAASDPPPADQQAIQDASARRKAALRP